MTVLAWTFAIVYGARSPWRATQAGRSVMATSVALGLIGAQLASVWIFGDYPGRAEVRAIVVLALVLTSFTDCSSCGGSSTRRRNDERTQRRCAGGWRLRRRRAGRAREKDGGAVESLALRPGE